MGYPKVSWQVLVHVLLMASKYPLNDCFINSLSQLSINNLSTLNNTDFATNNADIDNKLYIMFEWGSAGWDTELFTLPQLKLQDYICTICTGVYKNPILTECNHMFCGKCFQHLKTLKGEILCPLDRTLLRKGTFITAKFIDKIISGFEVRCPFRDCLWNAELDKLELHLTTCNFVIINCLKCKKLIKRGEKELHISLHLCQALNAELTKLKNNNNNNNNNNNISNNNNNNNDTKFLNYKIWENLNYSRLHCNEYISPYYWTIPNVMSQVEAGYELYSEGFLNKMDGYKFCARLNMKGHGSGEGTHLSLYLYVLKSEKDNTLNWPMGFGSFRATLIDQRDIRVGCHYSKIVNIGSHPVFKRKPEIERKNTACGWPKFISLFDAMDEKYFFDNRITIMLEINI